uniref:Nucelotide kinase n=1 Tax=Caudovirales sp. ctSH72 TaxID=2826773 RepID=A0A8S5QMN1_9CAUD|nr:MAG TPA: nucelotide kinase [Caudovirales sp. ctSH72]
MEEFKLGDRVFSPHFGFGIVETVFKDVIHHPYPVVVRWEQEEGRAIEPNTLDYYTLDGKYNTEDSVSDYNIVNMGRNILPKEYEEDERLEHVNTKRSPDDRKFKVGERVWSPYFGGGTVTSTESEASDLLPIKVHWDYSSLGEYDSFTEDGKFNVSGTHYEKGIYHIDPKDAEKVLPNIIPELGEDEEEENNKVEDAINPSHYKVDGLPEAIDIMNHLMTPEQFEGFLWGNIMKYAYRFGRKGDKGDTAGKIAWYADQLKAVEEWRKENET